jgi:nucleotide-binding universal stress UspA family protein
MDTIVVGVDDSPGARAALAWAARYAVAIDGRLRIVHAYEIGIAWIDAYSSEIPKWEARAREAAEDVLERIVGEVLDSSERAVAERVAVEGDAAHVLHEQSEDAELLVVGSRGRGGFKGLLLGSVSQRVAQHPGCPVVIVPTPHVGAPS